MPTAPSTNVSFDVGPGAYSGTATKGQLMTDTPRPAMTRGGWRLTSCPACARARGLITEEDCQDGARTPGVTAPSAVGGEEPC
jgi:hypothetical protein